MTSDYDVRVDEDFDADVIIRGFRFHGVCRRRSDELF